MAIEAPRKAVAFYPEKLLPEFKLHGAKSYLCRRIWQLAPPEFLEDPWLFFDACLGAGSMTYNAPATCQRMIACEANWHRHNVKIVLQNHLPKLQELLGNIHYSEDNFERACNFLRVFDAERKYHGHPSQLDKILAAANYIVRSKFSRGGLGTAYSWSERLRGGQPEQINAWESMIERLPKLSSRIQSVEFIHDKCEKWFEFVDNKGREAGKKAFCVLDPPYPSTTRSTSAKEYGEEEMSHEQHERMLRQVVSQKHTHFAICSYKNPLYDIILKDWNTVTFDMPNHSGQGKTKERRTECLYLNY